MTRAGIVAIVGRPNAGKSTLLNRLVGDKLSIVSDKPQSTRDRIVGIRTTDTAQMVFLDTPGLLEPRYALQRAMLRAAREALADADIIIHLIDARDADRRPLAAAAGLEREPAAPVLTVLNKIDLLDAAGRQTVADRSPATYRISAVTGEGISELDAAVTALLPESPFLYPAEDISTQTTRFFAAEAVREAAFQELDEEVPYSVACEVEEFREDRSPLYIRAVLYVERESQKRILIGAGGQTIRSIGRTARSTIEALVGESVYLDLWVKVLPNWRRQPGALARFGYRLPEDAAS